MKLIEQQLGRSLPDEERGSVPTLADLTDSLVEDARRLFRASSVRAVKFLLWLVADRQMRHVVEFAEDVLGAGVPVHEWVTRTYLCVPSIGIQRALRLNARDVLAPVHGLADTGLHRCAPTAGSLHEWTGIPGVIVRRRFDWNPPESVILFTGIPDASTEQVTDVDLACARWIAARIAHERLRTRRDGQPLDIATVCDQLGVAVGELSELARRSIAGLARERAELGPAEGDLPPGFKGPDDWYR